MGPKALESGACNNHWENNQLHPTTNDTPLPKEGPLFNHAVNIREKVKHELRVTSSNPRVRRLKARVVRLKAQVRRLKARVRR